MQIPDQGHIIQFWCYSPNFHSVPHSSDEVETTVEEDLNVDDVKDNDHTTAANPTPDMESNTSDSV